MILNHCSIERVQKSFPKDDNLMVGVMLVSMVDVVVVDQVTGTVVEDIFQYVGEGI